MSYYDIEDILSEDEKVSVIFNENCSGLGFLDQHQEYSDGKDIPKDTALEMPFWLGKQLSLIVSISRQSDFEEDTPVARIEIPKMFSNSFQSTLLADPTVINLSEKSIYFYEFGLKMAEIQVKDPAKLLDILICVYLKRQKQFARQSFHLIIPDSADMILKMARQEITLFNAGRKASMNLRTWKQEGTQNGHYHEIFSKLKRIKAN